MLRHLRVKGLKSLGDVSVSFPRVTVLFGPNAAGKSNLLDAVQALSRVGTCRTLSDALSEPIRGYPIEAFAFPPGGLPALLSEKESHLVLEADLELEKDRFRYRVQLTILPGSGALSVSDEYLTALTAKGEPKGTPTIERVEQQLRIRRKGKAAHPREERVGLNHSILSDPRLGGIEYGAIERCRNDLVGWRVYYLDPRVAMRSAKPPAEVSDIGVLGEYIAPFLYRLRAERPKHFEAIKRTLRSVVPSVEDLEVDLDKRRGTLDVLIRQDGTDFSSRIISEGTLRVLALCAIAVNPWGGFLDCVRGARKWGTSTANRVDRETPALAGARPKTASHRDDPLAPLLRCGLTTDRFAGASGRGGLAQCPTQRKPDAGHAF